MSSIIDELTRKRDDLLTSLDDTANRIAALPLDAPEEERKVLDEIFERDNGAVKRLTGDIRRRETIVKERRELKPQEGDEKDTPSQSGDRPVRVGNEPLTYRKRGPHSFFIDVRAASKGDMAANARLQQHEAEMRVELRDISNTAGAGGEFVPPLYLQSEWLPLLRAARPTADVLRKQDLPPGVTSIILPRLATGGATAIHTENAAVNEVDPTTGNVTANVREIAGQIDMSRMLFERSQPGLDEVLFADLARDYATKLDIQVLSGSGAAGQALGLRTVSGIGTVTYTDASPTVGELWPKVTDAIQRVTSAYLNPDTVVMHPRRAAMFLGAVDSTGRPLFNAGTPQNSMGDISGTVANGFAGGLQGMRVVIDPNVPTNIGAGTNEDVILVFDSTQIILYEEGAPRTRVFEDVGSGTLTVRLSVWGYFALHSARYPAAISVITGTGLTPPTF